MLRVFWAQSTNRISAKKPILVESEQNINAWIVLQTENCGTHIWTLSILVSLKLTSPLSKESHTLAQSPPLPPVHFLSSRLHRLDRTQDKKFCFPLFLSPTPPLLSVAHHTIFHATSLPHSLLALNDTVYTHAASIIPFHTSPGLFICLGVLGRHEGTLPSSFSLSSPFAFLSFSSSLQPLLAACGHWYTRAY